MFLFLPLMPISSYLTLIAFWWRTGFACTLLRLGHWPSKDPISYLLYFILLSMTGFIIYLYISFLYLFGCTGSLLRHAGSLDAACGIFLAAACGIQFPDQRWNLSPLHRECGVSATRPPGKSPCHFLADSPHPFRSVPLSFWCLLLSLDTMMVLPTSVWKEVVILGPNFFFSSHCQVKPWTAIHWECRAWDQNREDQGWGSE